MSLIWSKCILPGGKASYFGLKLMSLPPDHWVPHVLVMPFPPDLAILIDPSAVEVLEVGPSGTWTTIPQTSSGYQTNILGSPFGFLVQATIVSSHCSIGVLNILVLGTPHRNWLGGLGCTWFDPWRGDGAILAFFALWWSSC